jgi:hypothetical protein
MTSKTMDLSPQMHRPHYDRTTIRTAQNYYLCVSLSSHHNCITQKNPNNNIIFIMATDTVSLSVKWGKETVTLEKFVVAGGVKGLKAELEEKTSVPADRMKIMAKSKGW